MSEDYDPPLIHLPGSKLMPDVVLHRTLNKIHRIKAVMVVIQWDDGTVSTDWSSMKTSDICMMATIVGHNATQILTKNDDGVI